MSTAAAAAVLAAALSVTAPLPAAEYELHLRADADGSVRLDGEPAGQLAANEVRSLRLGPGQHLVSASSAGGEAGWERVVEVPRASGELPVELASQVRDVQRDYVRVPAGAFEMGCVEGDTLCGDDERPRHAVTVTRAFWMMRTEATVAAYRTYAQAVGLFMPPESDTNPGWAQSRHPIVNLSWNDAAAFCRYQGARLPTEAEWEYAARGGRTGERYVWGNAPTPRVAARKHANVGDERAKRQVQCDSCGWFDGYDDGFVYTAPVGSFVTNGFGLFDMAGNVWEWTADWYGERFYERSPAQDPRGREYGHWRALRGGSWSVNPVGLRTSYRFGFPPAERSDNFGVRCVRDVALP